MGLPPLFGRWGNWDSGSSNDCQKSQMKVLSLGIGHEIAWRKHHLTNHCALLKPQAVGKHPVPHQEALSAQMMSIIPWEKRKSHSQWPQLQNNYNEKGWVGRCDLVSKWEAPWDLCLGICKYDFLACLALPGQVGPAWGPESAAQSDLETCCPLRLGGHLESFPVWGSFALLYLINSP